MPVLNWIGKEAVVKHHKEVPFRLLEPVAELSYSPPYEGGVAPASGDGVVLSSQVKSTFVVPKPENHPVGETPPPLLGKEGSQSENLIVQGDNLHALKALLPRYAGQVKCIYIDPPYNTGNEGWAYNDNVKSPEILKWLGEVVGREGETLDRHDRWLCMMYPRLLLLKQFLREDGAIFVSIDDNEVSTLRSLMDEIFGTGNFSATFIWEKRTTRENRRAFSFSHDYVLCYAKNVSYFESTRGELPISQEVIARHRNPDNDPRGPWQSVAITAQAGHGTASQFYTITTPSGRSIELPHGNCWRFTQQRLDELILEKRIYFGPNGNNVPRQKKFLSEATRGLTPQTLWKSDEVGTTDLATRTVIEILGSSATFETPKSVGLLERILQIATDKDSLILDSFAGSGTTGHAVLKQNSVDGGNRKFILVEMDEKIARDVTAERVRRVAEGYSKANGDKVDGLGGGFGYYRLSAEPLFEAGGPIRKDVTFSELAEFVWFMETGSGRGSGPSVSSPHVSKGNTMIPQAEVHLANGDTALSESNVALTYVRATDTAATDTAFLGTYKNRSVFLLYNGILKDKTDIGGNVLNSRTLEYINGLLPDFDGERVIYGARSRFDKTKLAKLGITFHQLPYDLAVKTWF